MSTFDDAVRVSRQKASGSVPPENTQNRDQNNGVKNQPSLVQSRKVDSSDSKRNGLKIRGQLIQSRKGQPEGIDPNYLGIAVKPPSKTVQTVGTTKPQTGQTHFDEEEEYDEYYQPEDEDEEYDDDDEEDDNGYSAEYLYFLAQQQQQQSNQEAGPRVQIDGGPEPCSCFPQRSNLNVPSMLYEKVKCRHSELKGEAHAGVYKFDSNWNEFYEYPKRKKKVQPPPKTKFVFGYPKPNFIDIPETAGTEGYCEGEDYEGGEYWDYYKDDDESPEFPEPISEDDPNQPEVDSQYGKKIKSARKPKSVKSKMKKESKSDNPLSAIRLPRIGYSPPPSRERSNLSVISEPYSLPPVPESPFLAGQSDKWKQPMETSRSDSGYSVHKTNKSIFSASPKRRSAAMSRTRSIRRTLETPRRFKGKYYDSVTNKAMTYDIVPRYQKGTNQWRAFISEGTAGSKRGSWESRMPLKGYTSSGNRHSSNQIPEEEDDDYDEDDEYSD